MFFSFLSIVTSTVKLNIFYVFIVQIRKAEDSTRYASMTSKYLPMFLHSILYRVAAYSFFCVFLTINAVIPFCLIFICNVVISCIFNRPLALEGHILEKHIRYKENHSKIGLEKALQEMGKPAIWVNSFLGMFTPTCFLTGSLPEFVDFLTQEEYNKVEKQLAKHQKKIIRWQIITSTVIIFITTLIVLYMNKKDYTPSILSMLDFEWYCGLIMVQSLISVSFEIVPKFWRKITEKKALTVMCCLFLLALPLSLFFLSMNTSHHDVYIVSKSENLLNLEIVKGKLVNKGFSRLSIQQNSIECSAFNDIGDFNGKILILDQDCISRNIPSLSSKNDIEEKLKGAAGILFVSSQKYTDTQRSWKYDIFHSVTDFPIILVDLSDGPILKKMSGDVLELHAGDISKLLLNDTSSIYKLKCSSFPYIGKFKYNVVQNKERKGFYLGCKGNIKKSIKELFCQAKGSKCPEIEHFKRILLQRDPFGECNDKENRPTEGDQSIKHLLPNWICTDLILNYDQIYTNESKYDNDLGQIIQQVIKFTSRH